ncbi:TIR domain-containing protein [Rhizobium leguminosarum]|uniref:nSTAND1 domain-containing NTPase n=1 Tax=Rhizobium leguminosarum TaxID=384 RepID=UPI001C973DF5|nr:TIR domain-containing protein [Rhizobium leguminosarum]MBY5904156.1 TIR domain-containing protein [Rhizobium leguminosarum]MBY5911525.1 TIR domain-containing protein [Rhizobium leguminosarum]
MGALFISHSSKNNGAAVKVRDWLREQGWRDTFLDLDPEHGLAPGQRWQEELKKAGERCSAVIVLVSQEWVASRWCLTEFLVASQLGKRIFPILIAPTSFADLPVELTAHFQMADMSRPEIGEDGLNRLRLGLKRAGLDPKDFPWPPPGQPGRPPYRGLLTLEEADAAIFLGRDDEITRGLDALRRMRGGQRERVLVILGASGSGKSSFLRAGLLARLGRDEENFLVLPTVRPGRAALNGPAGLARSFGISGSISQEAIAARFTTLRAPVVDRLTRYAQAGQQNPISRPPTLILPIDQGEELFAADQQESADARETLVNALAADPDLLVVITYRSDSFAALQGETSLSAIPRLLFDLPALPLAAFSEVIEGPGRLAQPPIRFENKLSAQLVSDLDQADALPLLAFTLERLVEDHGNGEVIELAEYRDRLGGLGGALGKAADTALAKACKDRRLPDDPTAVERLARAAFIPWLLRLEGADKAPTRRVAVKRQLPAETWPLVEHLVDQRLLVSGKREDGEPTVEVSHEAVLRNWGLLGRWIAEEREALVQTDAVERAAADWRAAVAQEMDSLLLHREQRLAIAEKLLSRPDFAKRIGPDSRAYLAACRLAETQRLDREHEETKRQLRDTEKIAEQQRKVSRLTIIGAVLMMAFGVVAFFAWQLSNESGMQRNIALRSGSLRLAEVAKTAIRRYDYSYAAAIALEAVPDPGRNIDRPPVSAAYAVLAQAFAGVLPEAGESIKHGGAISSAAFSHDSKRLITASDDKTARLWDVATAAPIGKTMEHSDKVSSATFSPDGASVATISDDTMQLWNAATGEPIGKAMKHNGKVRDPSYEYSKIGTAIFGPGGSTVLTVLLHTVRLWDCATGAPIGEARKLQGSIDSVILSPDGKRAFNVSSDGTGKLWDAASETSIVKEVRSEEPITWAAFSPDGRRIVTISADASTQVWDVATGRPVGKPVKHDGPINSVAISPDGGRVLTVFEDTTARIWDVTTGAIGEAINHGRPISSAAFSPDSRRIVTVSHEATGKGPNVAEVWDATSGTLIGGRIEHEAPISWAGFSPDSGRILTISEDATARVWDATTGAPIGKVMKHDGLISSATFSPDGERILTASEDATARVWDAMTGAPIGKAMKHDGPISSADYSRDGRRILTASERTAQVWDADTDMPLGAAMIHENPWIEVGIGSGAFSPDGSRLATISADTVKLWDGKTGTPIGAMEHTKPVNSVAFSPDSKLIVTASTDTTARVWDAMTGAPIGSAMKHGGPIDSVSFSSGGQRILTASDEDATARVWDATTGAPIGKVIESVSFAAFSPDGSSVITASDDIVQLWHASTGALLRVMKTTGQVKSVAFSPDSERIVTTSGDTARLWNAATGEPTGEVMLHKAEVNFADFSPDGRRILTATKMESDSNDSDAGDSTERVIRLWSGMTGEPVSDFVSEGHGGPVAFSPDGKFILFVSGDEARLRDSSVGDPMGEPMMHSDVVASAVFSPDGKRVVTASFDSTAQVRDASTGTPIGRAMRHLGPVNVADFSPDGKRVVTASDDGTARLWDAASGTPMGGAMKHLGPVNFAAFSPDGRYIVTASEDGTAHQWDAVTGNPIGAAMKHAGPVLYAAFSPDEKLIVTTSEDRTARLWDPATGAPIGSAMKHEGRVRTAAFSSDSMLIVTASDDGTARLWHAASGKRVGEAMMHHGKVRCASFSHDNSLIVTASEDHTAQIWDAGTGKATAEPMVHDGRVYCAEFSPDGTRIVTASEDHTAQLWDVASSVPIGEAMMHIAAVHDAAFSPDGNLVVTASDDATSQVWRTYDSPQSFIDAVRSRLGRCLTPEERKLSDVQPLEDIEITPCRNQAN